MSARWRWVGARWWRFDFHTHTPASDDYGKGPNQATLRQRSPREWLLDFMHAEVDCVAVTDHNSGAWVDDLKIALAELDDERPEGYRPLTIFPGVEISVNGGVHVLAILEPGKSTSDIDSLLGAVGFSGNKGSSDAVTSKSFTEVVAGIATAGGLPIPAHVDGHKGLFNLSGTTLDQALCCPEVVAMEVVDATSAKPQLYSDKKVGWGEVLGSDSHHPRNGHGDRYPGSHYTWVKMGQPSLEGLRLALLDGPLSIRRSDAAGNDPNSHATAVIEALELSDARYMGRGVPLEVQLNPWLNAIIGGRGTGKSTLMEFFRIVLRRQDEIPGSLADDLRKYSEVYKSRNDDGLLTQNTRLAVVYRKDGTRFKVQWSPSSDVESILEEGGDRTWRDGVGNVGQRFPVRIFSQKQIYQLAKEAGALLRVVDQASEIKRHEWDQRWEAEERRFLSLRAKARELEAGISEESTLRGELEDIKRKLAVFEETGHADVLKEYQRRTRQQRAVESWHETWRETGERIRKVASEIVPEAFEVPLRSDDAEEDRALSELAEQSRQDLARIRTELDAVAQRADTVVANWKTKLTESDWSQQVDYALSAYEELKTRLQEEQAGAPSAYGELVQRRQQVEQRLGELSERRRQVLSVREQAEESLQTLRDLRRELTDARTAFLGRVLQDNEYVGIKVIPYGRSHTVEDEVRQILGRDGGAFEKDLGTPNGDEGLLADIYTDDEGAEAFDTRLETFKSKVRELAEGGDNAPSVRDQRFAAYLAKLSPEALDRLDLWFPEDSLDVKYSTTGDGQNFRSIQEGSPGQKTAALLAFLLSYGEEPLILDQPEDDLDNHLIYELIVNQIRTVKLSRQLIIVTHNPNIVVNGDAELVIALQPRGGQTQIESSGSLQDRRVRDTICKVMEGGREAFKRRYRRIALETSDV